MGRTSRYRVLLTKDTKPSASGRYSDLQYQENRRKLFAHLEEIAGRNPKISILEVDYSRGALEAVRRRYFPTTPAYPEKAFDGGPFHAYFYGLMKADAAYVVHMDSDMLFGGASQTWLEEAIGWLKTTSDALFAGPLPGPPTVDGNLPDLHRSLPGVLAIRAPERLAAAYPAYRFQSVSTRIFVLDCQRFESAANPLELVRPGFKRRLRARLFRQSPALDAGRRDPHLEHDAERFASSRFPWIGRRHVLAPSAVSLRGLLSRAADPHKPDRVRPNPGRPTRTLRHQLQHVDGLDGGAGGFENPCSMCDPRSSRPVAGLILSWIALQ